MPIRAVGGGRCRNGRDFLGERLVAFGVPEADLVGTKVLWKEPC